MKKTLVLALMAIMTMAVSAQDKKGSEQKQCCKQQTECPNKKDCKKDCNKDKKCKNAKDCQKGKNAKKSEKKTDAQTGATKQQ